MQNLTILDQLENLTFTSREVARRAFPLLDLTSLNNDDTPEKIIALCEKAMFAPLPIGAICIYAQFLAEAKKVVGDKVKLATVVNFPSGQLDADAMREEIEFALQHGADEIDLVFPYEAFLEGRITEVKFFMESARIICGTAMLKTILEVGAYPDESRLLDAAQLCIDAGSDFLKTSTGKIAQGASLESVAILLLTILKNGRPIGLKISGGIRTIKQVAQYFALTDHLMGDDWITSNTFRIGTSSLFDELLRFI